MALLNNWTVNNINACKPISSTTTAGGTQQLTRRNFMRDHADWINYLGPDRAGGTGVINSTESLPVGYYFPANWMYPITAGGMSASVDRIQGTGGVTSANLAGGRNATADLTGSGDITNANAALVTSMVAALTGSGNITNANLIGIIDMVAALVGSGDITGSITALANITAALTGVGDMSGTSTAQASMSAAINVTGDALSTANVGEAIWGAIASQFNEPLTMGAIMNSLSSGADPWATTLPGSYTANQAGALFYIMHQILRNKTKTDPSTGIMTVYADDGTTVLFTANVYNDANGATPYDGTAGINLKDRLS